MSAFYILGTVYDVRNAAMNSSNKRPNFFFHGSYILIGELDNKYIKSMYNMQVVVRRQITQGRRIETGG